MVVAMKSTSGLTLSIVAVLLFGPSGDGIARAGLKGACAKVNITPPLGIPLIGSQGKPSDAARDELYAKAMVLSDGPHTVAIISADLLYTPLEEITGPVRMLIANATGIPERNVMVCATHTHSGPEVFTRSKVPADGRMPVSQIDQSYLSILVKKMADSVQLACRDMQDVTIGGVTGSLPEVLYNRRPKTADGRVSMAFTVPAEVAATRRVEMSDEGDVCVTFSSGVEAQRAFGPIDPAVHVLRMEDAEGAVIGSIVGFGCHPVCIYPHLSTTISADYPAWATGVIEQAEGGVCLFTLGLAGNTVPLQRGPEPCRRIGRALGGEALKRLQLIATTGDVTLKALSRQITLPTRSATSAAGDPNDRTPDHVTTEIQAIMLGDTTVLGLPGEVLVEVGLAIRKKAAVKDLFIVTLANDAVGYVCHSAAYEEGGYEPDSGTNLAKGAGEIMIEQALTLIREIAELEHESAEQPTIPGGGPAPGPQ